METDKLAVNPPDRRVSKETVLHVTCAQTSATEAGLCLDSSGSHESHLTGGLFCSEEQFGCLFT